MYYKSTSHDTASCVVRPVESDQNLVQQPQYLRKNSKPRLNYKRFIQNVTDVEVSYITKGLQKTSYRGKRGAFRAQNKDRSKENMSGGGESHVYVAQRESH